jgi:hypothetical protein
MVVLYYKCQFVNRRIRSTVTEITAPEMNKIRVMRFKALFEPAFLALYQKKRPSAANGKLMNRFMKYSQAHPLMRNQTAQDIARIL